MLLPEATPAQVERLNGEFRRMYDNCGFPSSVLYEGVRETLDILSSRGDELFLVTNKPVKPTQELLRKFGLKVFRDLICPDMHGPRNIAKDEMIKIILERHGLNRRRTIMVGDAELDIHAARTAGVRVAAALYGYGDSEKIITLKPDFLLKEFSGLLTLCAGPE
ncbi:MAG: hypothetical protein A2089_12600 [Elusimicrobia bacterium GWD2_63_28]|nr:MAG: hypothetical protein A2089_12600 [Elusimicrobia bacterium GWD2_63_28]